MEAAAAGSPQRPDDDEPTPSADLPRGAPPGLREAANRGGASPPLSEREREDANEDAREEHEALDFLLGATKALEFDVPVEYDTPKGRRKLIFVVKQQDGARILEIEDRNRKGTGPFAELDEVQNQAELVAEATVTIRDEAGKEVDPRSQEFIGGAVTPADAMRVRFKYQTGLLGAIAAEIKVVSGYGPGRVSSAERAMRDAVSD